MIQLFCKKKGAISVFLSLILMPVMIVAFLATDVARIYSAKVIVSDAGEMAMNAGLAQYNFELKDEYGFIAMEKIPSSMQGDLEKYFSDSLNMSQDGRYHRILDLMEEQFSVLDIEASKLYKTEVEKQQILEYMKYRAPVCFAELLLDKLNQIKDTKKMLEAMEAEADFAEAMQDVQDAFEDAKLALDSLNTLIESFPTQDDMENELYNTQRDYTGSMSMDLLMRKSISMYDAYDRIKVNNADTKEKKFNALKSVLESYNNMAGKIGRQITKKNYDYCIDTLYYQNTINKLGGEGKLLRWYDELQAANKKDDSENAEQEEEQPDPAERQSLVNLVNTYRDRKNVCQNFSQSLLQEAKSIVKQHSEKLNSWWELAKTGKKSTDIAQSKLEKVISCLKEAARRHQIWEDKANQLADKGSMEKELEDTAKLFDTENAEILKYNIETDGRYFNEVKDILTEEKFYGLSIASASADSQANRYLSEAEFVMKGRDDYHYDAVKFVCEQTYTTDYHHTEISTSVRLVHIQNDPFYNKLKEYCENNSSEEKNSNKNGANKSLKKGSESTEEAKKEDASLKFQWPGTQQPLPSTLLGVGMLGTNASKLTDIGSCDIDNKSERKGLIKNVKESMREASSFLDGVSRILEGGLESLYIVEYGMQMLSYYTVNKQMNSSSGKVETLKDADSISLSGYKLSSHKAYRSEVEYILWGKAKSAQNVQLTVAVIYGIRLLFNAFFALTNSNIERMAKAIAAPWAVVSPYLEPIIKIVFKFGLALCETGKDIQKIKDGYGVAVIKNETTWESGFVPGMVHDSTKGKFLLDYSEYLRIMLCSKMLGNETAVLARIGDCVQVNTEKCDITKMYTMLAVEATVKNRTTFIKKIASWSNASWEHDNNYTIQYKSVLGY